MDRLEIARRNYARIVPGPYQLDEEKSEELEAWLREDVVPVVADLQKIPAFRRNIRFGLCRLVAHADTPERSQVEAVSNALVDAAREIVRIGRLDQFKGFVEGCDPVKEPNQAGQGVSSETEPPSAPQHHLSSWSITEKMAERPWFDLAMDLDFPYLHDHLYLAATDSSLDDAFASFRPKIPILGDGVTRMMFARIDFWTHQLQNAWNRIFVRITKAHNSHTEYERFFTTRIHLDECVETLRASCLSGNDSRMRDACCTLIQVYIAYHPRPQLPWLDLTEDRYQAVAGMLGLEFKRPCDLVEYEIGESSKLQERARRQAKLVLMDALQKVAASLEDVAPLYRSTLSPDEMIDEARCQYRLVVVTKPRMAFFDGTKLNVDWNKKSKPWELLRYLAAKGERLDSVDKYDLSGNPSPGALSTTKGRLCQYLMESDESPTSPGSQLACRIEITKEGEYHLDLAPKEIKLLDLEYLGVNEWTVDPAEFDPVAQ